MKAKAALTVLAFIVCVVGLVAAITFSNAVAAYQDPARLAREQEALRHEQTLNQIAEQQALDDHYRWASVRTSVASTLTVAIPVGFIVIAIGSMLLLGVYTLREVQRVHHKHTLSKHFVLPDEKTGAWPVSVLSAIDGATIEMALLWTQLRGETERAHAANMLAHADLSKIKDLRHLTLRDGNDRTVNRMPASRPILTAPPAGSGGLVPNQPTNRVIGMNELGQSPEPYALPWGLDPLTGEAIWTSLPGRHRLIAGATQSGKSQLVQMQLKHLTDNYTEDQLGLILIDPKHTGLAPFWNHPLTMDFGNDVHDWQRVLDNLEQERDRRQRMFQQHQMHTWQPGQVDPDGQPVPLLLLVIDELAQVLDDADSLKRLISLCALGASAGISVTGMTQYASSALVAQHLKANMVERVCGYVPDNLTSRAVLDRGGAEMLAPYQFLGNWSVPPTPFQAPYAGYMPVGKGLVVEGHARPAATSVVAPSVQTIQTSPEQQLLDALAGGPMSRTAIYQLFGNTITQDEVNVLVSRLKAAGKVVEYKERGTGGRPAEMLRLP